MASLVPKVELFGTRECPYTAELREHLEWNRITFVEFDVERDAAAHDRLRRLTHGRLQVPVLVTDGQVAEVGWRGRSCLIP